MITTSTTPRLGAAAIAASAIGATTALGDISAIDGSIRVEGRSEVQSGGVFLDAEDQYQANINANEEEGIAPLDAVLGYDHGLSLASALGQQSASTDLFFDSSTLGFNYQSSARVESGPGAAGETAQLRGSFDAGFNIRSSTDTVLDIVIGIEYIPGAEPGNDISAFIGVNGIPNQPGFDFQINEKDEPFSARLEISTTLGAGQVIGINAEAMYDMQTFGGDQGLADIRELGSIALFAQVTVAPAPAPLALLGLGSLAATRRRR